MTKMPTSQMYVFAVLFILVRVVCTQECTAQNCLRCHQNHSNFCSKCISGYYVRNLSCYNCGPQCQSCASYGCNSCYEGYWGNTCDKKCAQKCTLCRKSNGYCLSCKPGHYLYYGKCTTCGTHCAVCGRRECASCYDGYWGSSCDKNCAQNCVSCSKLVGYCLSCDSGYYFHHGKCTTCGKHCAVCGQRRCTSCHDGYWGSICDIKCAQNCTSCIIWDGYCLSCKPGHYLNNTFCYPCGTLCSLCDSTGCQSCFDGYWGSACENSCVSRCSESKCERSNGNCLSCVLGYWGNKCEHPCEQHCSTCNKKSGECISCKNGYWGHLCTACGSHCEACNQSNGCSDVGNRSEKQTTMTEALGGGLGGGVVGLIILAIIAMLWFRKRRRSNTERNTSLHDARKDYDTVDANVREVELNDLRYEALQGTDVHTMDQTTDYSNVSENVNDNITYQNVCGGSFSD